MREKIKRNIIMFGLVFIILAFFVAADNGMFDNTNYNEYNLYNATNVSAVGNIIVESGNKICYTTDCSHYSYYNGTHVVMV